MQNVEMDYFIGDDAVKPP